MEVFAFAYLLVVVGISIYVLVLLARFVEAHQRGAQALESIAKKLPAPLAKNN